MNVSIKEAAQMLGVSQQFLRIALQQKMYPFGIAVRIKDSCKYTYYINLNQLKNYINAE